MKTQEDKKYTIELFYKDSIILYKVSSNIKDIINQYCSRLEKYHSIKRTKDLRKIKFTDGKFVQPITNDYKIVCTEYQSLDWVDLFKKQVIEFDTRYDLLSASKCEEVYSELLKTQKPQKPYYKRSKNEKRK